MVPGRLLAAVFLSAFAFACTATPAGQDLMASDSTDPTPDPGPDPALPCVSKSCPAGEQRYATLNACTTGGADRCASLVTGCGATVYCGRFDAQCTAVPSCFENEFQVTRCNSSSTCHTRTMCGASIFCQEETATCDAYPSCDAGDKQATQIDACKNADCYSRTVCGSTIWCIDL